MDKTPLVSICSITYNHAPYIRQCLDSMLMQKTDFQFEIIINDDSSTDGTTEIIREYARKYPDIITPVFHEDNQYQKGVRGMFATFCFPRARGKYIALCEGDDYWTDPLKLQKQVDILEKNSAIQMVYTGFETVNANSEKIICPNFEFYMQKSRNGDIFRELIKSNFIMTLTCCFKKEIFESNLLRNCPNLMDYAYFLCAASIGCVCYIPDITGAYRRLDTGMIKSNNNNVETNLKIIAIYYIKQFIQGKINKFSTAEKIRIYFESSFFVLKTWISHRSMRKQLHEIMAFNVIVLIPFAFVYLCFRKLKLIIIGKPYYR